MRRRSLLGWAPIALLVVILLQVVTLGLPARQWILVLEMLIVLAAIVWQVVQARRDRRRYEDELARRAAAHATAQQRLELARDVHDAMSHRLGAITMRAALAQRMPDRVNPEETLQLIETMSRAATDDLRGLLDELGRETAERDAGPPLRTLAPFVEAMERAGLAVRLQMDLPDALPVDTERAVSLLIREALGNCLRHAGPVRASVGVSMSPDAVRVRVSDDGPHPGWQGAPGTGHGLASVRDQVAALGGTVEYGPAAHGGWQVRAEVPLRGASS